MTSLSPQFRSMHPQVRRQFLRVKHSLRGLHEGPFAQPRKAVFAPLGISESLYSRWLSDTETELPSLLQLAQIVSLTGDPEPFRAILTECGEGYDLIPLPVAGQDSIPTNRAHALLARHVVASSSLASSVAEALRLDGVLDGFEANGLLPHAEENLRSAQETVDALRRLAASRFRQ